MSRGDRRGPGNTGPVTGRGLGYCSGNDQPGFAADAAPQGAGRGLRNGSGRGSGSGHRHGRNCRKSYGGAAAGQSRRTHQGLVNINETADFNSPESRDREVTRLENIANTLSSELEIVKNKIDQLKNN